MKRPLLVAVILAVLLPVHRLPAPIREPTPEVPTARPQTGPAKHKSAEPPDSTSTRRFDGTWTGTSTANSAGATFNYRVTLVIKDGRTADATTEVTANLLDPRGWANFSEEAKHLSPLSYKFSNHSDHLVVDGIDLMIRWSGRKVLEWAPKTVRLQELQQTLIHEEPRVSTFTLRGDELVVGNGQSKFIYHRAK